MLTACVFVSRDTVRHPRRFVFEKFDRKPNCSWSEAFVNRGWLYLERWPAASNETGQSVLISMKGRKIPRFELSTFHLYQHYSMFMHDKLQHTWLGGYCDYCPTPRLYLKFEHSPSWNDIHDTFPTLTAQDTKERLSTPLYMGLLKITRTRLNSTYVYRHKHNYILCSMFTITKVQLHVSAISVGHLQVIHEELINKLYQCVWGVYSLWGGVGTRSRFVLEEGVWTGAV